MSGKKCKHCGSSEIEVDPARGDAVCTNCGTVLEDNIIVAEVEFQENAHGGASAIGQFVSAESKGGATGFGGAFNAGIGQESREVTIRKARDGITALCQQLRLNQQCIDIACNFFKMALSRHLTIGRPASQTQAACVYMTCRTEGTAHLLIDISDALQICCYQLGRTYFRLSRALCINIPPTDPCLYILRFSSQLQFEDKSHEVSMTALRLVQRMKRDSIHSGRRPSGICGAALLIAARLHNFSRTPSDVVRIVKVHESTLRKRLLEFGDTPSSALTLEEFMTVDLEEEQDPPAFRAARKKDRERLQKLMEEEDGEKEMTDLQKEIDAQLEKDNSRRKKVAASVAPSTPLAIISDNGISEDAEASRFAAEDTLNLLGELASEVQPKTEASLKQEKLKLEKGLGPDLAVIGLGQPDDKDKFLKPSAPQFGADLVADELVLAPTDEDYVSSLIMSEEEARHKTQLWNKVNAGYLRDQKSPDLAVIGLGQPDDKDNFLKPSAPQFGADLVADELLLAPGDEDYVSSLIMSEEEARHKTQLWNKVNTGYLRDQKIKEEMRAREREEGKDKKKKVRGSYKKKTPCNAATAGEAIEKMLAEKRISMKINYNILKTLDHPGAPVSPVRETATPVPETKPPTPVPVPASPVPKKRKKKAAPTLAPAPAPAPAPHPASPAPAAPATPATPATPAPPTPATDAGDDYDEDVEPEPVATTEELSLGALLHNGQEEDYYDYEEY